jgi:hypothetical protein
MNFNKPGNVFTSKFVGSGPSSYKKKNLLGSGLIQAENHCHITHRITGVLDVFHRPVFFGVEARRFGNWISFRPQVKGPN